VLVVVAIHNVQVDKVEGVADETEERQDSRPEDGQIGRPGVRNGEGNQRAGQ
jgi:hypothetical protein